LRRLGRRRVDLIRAEWDRRAKKRARSKTHSDLNIRRLEIDFTTRNLKGRIGRTSRVLDVGCGDGLSTREYAPNAIGIDYNATMARVARHRGLQTLVADVGHLPFVDGVFDAVVSMRTLINVPTSRLQMNALDEMIRVTRRRGMIVLAETSRQGLCALNRLRQQNGLKMIAPPWFNRPLDEHRLSAHISSRRKLTPVALRRYNLYFLITRILHPLFVSPNEPDPGSTINRIAADIAMTMPDPSFGSDQQMSMTSQMICLALSRQ
jgi:ubiquinone/menaquinone biosynthesis C-methylase UbiE